MSANARDLHFSLSLLLQIPLQLERETLILERESSFKLQQWWELHLLLNHLVPRHLSDQKKVLRRRWLRRRLRMSPYVRRVRRRTVLSLVNLRRMLPLLFDFVLLGYFTVTVTVTVTVWIWFYFGFGVIFLFFVFWFFGGGSAREMKKGNEIAWYADGNCTVRNEYNPNLAYAFGQFFSSFFI